MNSTWVKIMPDGKLWFTCPCCGSEAGTVAPVALVLSAGEKRVAESPVVGARGRMAWSRVEDEILRQLYPQGGYRMVQRELPQRSRLSIIQRAQKTGVLFRAPYRVWTPEQVETLRRVYPSQGGAAAARATGHAPGAVWMKASELGLRSTRKPGPQRKEAAA